MTTEGWWGVAIQQWESVGAQPFSMNIHALNAHAAPPRKGLPRRALPLIGVSPQARPTIRMAHYRGEYWKAVSDNVWMICRSLSYRIISHEKAQKAQNRYDSAVSPFSSICFLCFCAFSWLIILRGRYGWRSGLIRRWSSYPFCRGYDGGRCWSSCC